MRRIFFATLSLLLISGSVGCMNVARIGCEAKEFYLDLQRNIFGIDYPHGQPEFPRQRYIGIADPGPQPLCDN